jgi:hypothetical protein
VHLRLQSVKTKIGNWLIITGVKPPSECAVATPKIKYTLAGKPASHVANHTEPKRLCFR